MTLNTFFFKKYTNDAWLHCTNKSINKLFNFSNHFIANCLFNFFTWRWKIAKSDHYSTWVDLNFKKITLKEKYDKNLRNYIKKRKPKFVLDFIIILYLKTN